MLYRQGLLLHRSYCPSRAAFIKQLPLLLLNQSKDFADPVGFIRCSVFSGTVNDSYLAVAFRAESSASENPAHNIHIHVLFICTAKVTVTHFSELFHQWLSTFFQLKLT